eukprot:g52887.t1
MQLLAIKMIGSLLADTPIPSTNAQDNDDEDHTPLLVSIHENTNIPDSPTHDTEQPQHSESEQQDELSLEQSLQDDSYKQVSIGPTPNSDFTAPDADYTDPNQYVEGQVQGEPTRFHKRRLYPKFKILTVNCFQKNDIRRNRTSDNCGRCETQEISPQIEVVGDDEVDKDQENDVFTPSTYETTSPPQFFELLGQTTGSPFAVASSSAFISEQGTKRHKRNIDSTNLVEVSNLLWGMTATLQLRTTKLRSVLRYRRTNRSVCLRMSFVCPKSRRGWTRTLLRQDGARSKASMMRNLVILAT